MWDVQLNSGVYPRLGLSRCAMADLKDVSDIQRLLRGVNRNLEQRAARTFPNIYIGENARVHVGDAYYDHLTINQFCQMRAANDAIVQQLGSLQGL